MSNREDRLRSLLDKVRAKRPEERTTHAAEALDRIRTASGTTAAAVAPSSPPLPPSVRPTPIPSSLPTQAAPERHPSSPTSRGLDSPTRYSSQPPRVERPLSSEPRAQSVRPVSVGPSSAPPAARRAESIRPQSVVPTGQPVVYATDPPEFPRPKTFGDLLELTLSLRPR
ncbi:MAG: hypothetical protein JRE81_10690 [Deltaproteobacteria bacterium]|jgi:hypothetical protein|nr:hypothetical protein [Deltaproteobacteria bacterium]